MANTITIEFSAEDRARIDRLTAALEGHQPKCDSCVAAAVGAMKAAQEAPQEFIKDEPPFESSFQVLTDDHPADNPFEAPTKDEPKVERADIQRKVVELSGAGKKAEVREIVKAYADKVSGIPEDKLAEVMAKLTGLEGCQ